MGMCKTQAFLLQVLLVIVFYHSHGKHTKMIRQQCSHRKMLTFGRTVRKMYRGGIDVHSCYIFVQMIILKNERQNK